MTEPDPVLATLEAENAALRRRLAEVEPIAAKYAALCLISPNLMLVINERGDYVEIDPTPSFTPAMIAERTGKNLHWTFPAALADEMLAAIHRTLATGRPETLEYAVPQVGHDARHAAILTRLTPTSVLWFAQDVTAARRLERAEQDLIDAQHDALRELSTPLLPLADGVIAMPLIGTLDAGRAQQVMEKLLEGVVRLRAHTAILDVTGVRTLDADAADGLLRVARAARLLGARVILSGIGPDVARILVDLQADLTGITTRNTLESSITEALHGARGAR